MKFIKLYEEFNFWDDSNDKLADWQERWDQLMIDMEEEAEPEGGPIADDYGQRMEDMEKEREEIMAQNKVEDETDDSKEGLIDSIFKELEQVLNQKQISNLLDYMDEGERDEEFIRHRLNFYGIEDVDSALSKLNQLNQLFD